jgi:two-component system chemotaxis response regulator CheB
MANELIRILIVDDSRIFRGVLEKAFSEIPNVVVVGSVFSGQKALEFLQQTPIELATLDIEMPGVDGLETLKAIRELNRSRPAAVQTESVLISSLTKQGASCTVEGLQLGAIDFILKPSGGTADQNMSTLRKALIEKLAIYRLKRHGKRDPIPTDFPKPRTQPESPRGPFKAIAIGISTGGPETLAKLLPDLVGRTEAPIFIVQHNLNGLSGYMADSLSRRVGYCIAEAQEGMPVAHGGVYLAQSGSHMILRKSGNQIEIGLSDAPPENHSRPAVDVFLRSAVPLYGSSLIAAIMTGMLNDGANGVRVVKRAGGFVIAQDQATSVIWGMPRAAIETGAVDAILPLDKIAPTMLALIEGKCHP